MDGRSFDRLARALAIATGRRQVLRSLAAIATGGVLTRLGINSVAAVGLAIDYFALGDSIASGHGLEDTGDGNGAPCQPDGASCCRRSGQSYPYRLYYDRLLARYAPGAFHHLACSGAASPQLRRQVDQVVAKLSSRPTLVTITMGANDFGWSDPAAFEFRLYWERRSEFDAWVDDTVFATKAGLRAQVGRLLRYRNVVVVLTEVYNPFNENSVFFKYGVGNRCGVVNCYQRTQVSLDKLNRAFHELASEINQPDRFRVTTGLRLAFSPYSSPRGYHYGPVRKGVQAYQEQCGYAAPDVADTFIQYRTDPNSNSYPDIPEKVGGPGEWRGDCFHPNRAGAAAIATKVDQALVRMGFASGPKITAGPNVAPRATAAAVAWSTDVPASSVVVYGTTTSYDRSVEAPEPVSKHSLQMTGLQSATTYHYRVKSATADGTAVSQDRTFTTKTCAEVTPGTSYCVGRDGIGRCVNTQTNANNCGGCGNPATGEYFCRNGKTCVDGVCTGGRTSETYVFVSAWGGLGSEEGQFMSGPTDVALDEAGNAYACDAGNNRIQKFASDGTFLAQWRGFDDNLEDELDFLPWGIAVGAGGNVYVADIGHYAIQKFTGDGTFLTQWGSNGRRDGQFQTPQDLAVDGRGDVYVVDSIISRIQKFTSAGVFITNTLSGK